MKKIIFTFIMLVSFNAYAEIEDCDDTLSMIENAYTIDSLLNDKNYSYKKYSGKLCISEGGMDMAFILKNGKLAGPIEFQLSDGGKLAFYLYSSSYKFLTQVDNMAAMNLKDMKYMDKAMSKLDIIMKTYYDNGNEQFVMDIKKGNGTVTSYRDDGSMESLMPVKNFQVHGKGEIYDEKGKLYAHLQFNKDELVSGKCANERKNGSEWTKAEISNWEQGLEVDCN